jgi:hypothetical protein
MHDSRQRRPALCDRLLDDLPTYLAENYDEILLHLRWTFRFYPVDGAITSLNFDNKEGGVEHKNAPRVNYPASESDSRSGYAKLQTLKYYIKKLGATERPVTVIGPIPEPGWHVGQTNMKQYLRGENFRNLSTSYKLFYDRNRYILAALAEIDNMPNVRVIYPHLSLCSDSSGRCRVQTAQAPFYWDDDHLSHAGVNVVLPDILRSLSDVQ